MISLYRFLIILIFILSPIIILIRILKKKEDIIRFREKFCFFSEDSKKNVIWFHGASVGEILSVIPLIENLEKNKNIKKILITSNTLSSSKIIKRLNLKKTIHQFFPIDTNYHSNKFLEYWKPKVSIFIDSEIWPNMILNIKKKSIPLVLLNARISNKTFKKWFFFKKSSAKLFENFDLCFAANKETEKYLKILGVKKIEFLGNLKFSQRKNNKTSINQNLSKIIDKKKIWCAASTHFPEERLCIEVHKNLKKDNKNLLTIIIPRHIERVKDIIQDLRKENLKYYLDSSSTNIPKDTELYIVDSYGKTESFYKISKIVFLGGSFIKHGGQNPIEPAKLGCKTVSGPHIWNFKEIYKFLNNKKVTTKAKNSNQLAKIVKLSINKKSYSNSIKKKLKMIGDKILQNIEKKLNPLINR